MLRGRYRLSTPLLLVPFLAACATPEVPVRDAAPRTSPVPGAGTYYWTVESGWVQPENGSWGPDESLRVEARRAFDAGAYADALAGFLVLDERGVRENLKELAFYIAECYYQLGQYENALEYYRRVYKQDFPSAEFMDRARERVFDIGMAFLKRRVTRSFLTFEYFSPGYGVEILIGPKDGLITENAFLPYADDALIAAAEYYFDEQQYPEAVPLYDDVVAMERSEWRDYAEYKAALAEWRQVRGAAYDESKIHEAERRFRAYLLHHPRGEHWEDVRAKLREIAEMEGQKSLEIAKFYLKESQPRACEIYLRLVLDRYPNSSAAREARDIRDQLDRIRGRW